MGTVRYEGKRLGKCQWKFLVLDWLVDKQRTHTHISPALRFLFALRRLVHCPALIDLYF